MDNYTKHYYVDDQRIASKIGTGFMYESGYNSCDLPYAIPDFDPNYLYNRLGRQITIMEEELNQVTDPNNRYGNTIAHIDIAQGDFCNLDNYRAWDFEQERFFYHGNHLSSTQLVMDNNGSVVQGVLYAPFGEVITDYNAYHWQNGTVPDYLFNAKELDEESGTYYYSARYYAPPTFISRDPLFHSKPTMSPYAYCSNNPVIMIDPDGRDEYEFDKKGKLVNTIVNKNADILRIVKTDRKGNIKTDRHGNTKTVATSQNYNYGTITNTSTDGNITQLDIKDNISRGSMFEFLADNTNVEWGTINATSIDINDAKEINVIGTSHSRGEDGFGTQYIEGIVNQKGTTINEYTHSHPRGTLIEGPSGYDISAGAYKDGAPFKSGDHAVANKYYGRILNLRVYDVGTKSYFKYWGGGSPNYKKVKN